MWRRGKEIKTTEFGKSRAFSAFFGGLRRRKNFILSLSLPPVSSLFKHKQVVDELFAYWTLENSEDALEELEEALIVSRSFFLFPKWSLRRRRSKFFFSLAHSRA